MELVFFFTVISLMKTKLGFKLGKTFEVGLGEKLNERSLQIVRAINIVLLEGYYCLLHNFH